MTADVRNKYVHVRVKKNSVAGFYKSLAYYNTALHELLHRQMDRIQ